MSVELDLVKRNQQKSGVPRKKEADKNEFEKIPNSNMLVIWKMNFESEVCSSSSLPTEGMKWIAEVVSAWNMDELKSATSV